MTTPFVKFCRRLLHTSTPRLGGEGGIGPSKSSDHDGGYKIYRNIAIFLMFPLILLVAGTCYVARQEEEKPPPFVPYEYMRRRTKPYPWGNGQQTFFHNSRLNALPDGYEKTDDEDEEVPE